MIFQTAMTDSLAEMAFRAVQSSVTATATSTSRLRTGEPVILATHTASNNGMYAQSAATSTAIINNLYIGNVHQTIEHESLGLVQCYGYDSDASFTAQTDTVCAAGRVLRPSSFKALITAGDIPNSGTVTDQVIQNGVAGLVVALAAPTTTVATETVTVACKVHIRAM